MSVAVDITKLADSLADFDQGYLLTASAQGIIKINGIVASVRESQVVVPIAGMQARLNIADNPTVSLLWPPRAAGGYSLIVDGTARFTDEEILVTPTRGILHRPAVPAVTGRGDDGSCVQDCSEI